MKGEKKHSVCDTWSEHGGKSTREGDKNGVGRRERMKRGRGINDRDERSRGIEIWIADAGRHDQTTVCVVCYYSISEN